MFFAFFFLEPFPRRRIRSSASVGRPVKTVKTPPKTFPCVLYTQTIVKKMTDFVHEQVNQLNTALSSIFQNQQVFQQINTTTTTVTDPVQALDQNDLDLFLTCASRDIDLACTTTLPDIDLVKKYLDLYSKYSDSNRSKSNNENSLEWLFVAKCTVAVYGFMLKNILSSTLPLSEAIQYWHSIYGSRRYETYYALQSKSCIVCNSKR